MPHEQCFQCDFCLRPCDCTTLVVMHVKDPANLEIKTRAGVVCADCSANGMRADRMLYVFTDGIDRVVATSEDDAREVLREHCGEPDCEPAFEMRDFDEPAFERCDFDEDLTIVDYDGKGGTKTQTMREWMVEYGRGFLCSSEF